MIKRRRFVLTFMFEFEEAFKKKEKTENLEN